MSNTPDNSDYEQWLARRKLAVDKANQELGEGGPQSELHETWKAIAAGDKPFQPQIPDFLTTPGKSFSETVVRY